jgi:hypothetical protein
MDEKPSDASSARASSSVCSTDATTPAPVPLRSVASSSRVPNGPHMLDHGVELLRRHMEGHVLHAADMVAHLPRQPLRVLEDREQRVVPCTRRKPMARE